MFQQPAVLPSSGQKNLICWTPQIQLVQFLHLRGPIDKVLLALRQKHSQLPESSVLVFIYICYTVDKIQEIKIVSVRKKNCRIVSHHIQPTTLLENYSGTKSHFLTIIVYINTFTD
jgi:hypothetical protein